MSENDKNIEIFNEDDFTETLDDSNKIEVGQWYWDTYKDDKENEKNNLWVVTHIGSNYVKLETTCYTNYTGKGEVGEVTKRIHFKDFDLKRELNPKNVINENTVIHQKNIENLTNEMKLLCKSANVGETQSQSTSMALSLPDNSKQALTNYENGLIELKDVKLPEIEKSIRKEAVILASWLQLESIQAEIPIVASKAIIKNIEERIHNVSLYAGLDDKVTHVKIGAVADKDEIIHIMQRMHYMDEESLIDYHAGGMEFDDLKDFDNWIKKDKNFYRLLPFNKTIASFQVRRKAKERKGGIYDTFLGSWIKFNEEFYDKKTFLYVRNGDNLYRLSTSISFNEILFPDEVIYGKNKDFMIRKKFSNSDEIEFLEKSLYEEYDDYGKEKFEPFDSNSVYYDDALNQISEDLKIFNKTALVIQGIFDRTNCLHPLPKINLMDENSFKKHIKLINDFTRALTYKKPPSFEEYRDKCNESIKNGSVCFGQRDVYMEEEEEKFYRKNGYDSRKYFTLDYGNPGVGEIAKVEKYFPRAKKVSFSWERERLTYDYYKDDLLKARFTTEVKNVFNISAYKKGDYKQFFEDPRTRQEYIKWAPFLLTTEDFHSLSEDKKELALISPSPTNKLGHDSWRDLLKS